MKADLREIYCAPTRAAAEAAIDVFADKYGAKYDRAVACLTKDREALLAFFDFPAEHWDHLRTSNPIESGRNGTGCLPLQKSPYRQTAFWCSRAIWEIFDAGIRFARTAAGEVAAV